MVLVTCVGPTSAGKTTLLKKLTQINDKPTIEDDNDDEISVLSLPKTIPTVGVNQYRVLVEGHTRKEEALSSVKHFCFGDELKRDLYVEARELGGAIAPLWPSYIRQSVNHDRQHLIYVIDVADTSRFAEAGVQLVETLTALRPPPSATPLASLSDAAAASTQSIKNLGVVNLLVVLAKIDLLEPSSKARHISNLISLLRLDHLTLWYNSSASIKIEVVEYSAESGQGLDIVFDWLRAQM